MWQRIMFAFWNLETLCTVASNWKEHLWVGEFDCICWVMLVNSAVITSHSFTRCYSMWLMYEVTCIIIQGLSLLCPWAWQLSHVIACESCICSVFYENVSDHRMKLSACNINSFSSKNCPSVLAKEGDFLSCSFILLTPRIMISELIFVMQQQENQRVSCQVHTSQVHIFMCSGTQICLSVYMTLAVSWKYLLDSYITRCIVRSRIS